MTAAASGGSIVIVGASLAGLRAAEALRAADYKGSITVVGDESHLPYDRPPLSKEILLGSSSLVDIELISAADREALRVEWLLGEPATGLVAGGVGVGDRVVPADGVVIATGARARSLPFCGLGGVHTMRTLDDAVALREDLVAGCSVVIIGAGFIGTEIASAAVSLGCHVSIVEPDPAPLSAKIGPTAATKLMDLIASHGVVVRAGHGVGGVDGKEQVKAVVLDDGSRLNADVVVVGVGAIPNIEWLHGSGIELDNGVLTDEWGRTSLPNVVAAGDVACFKQGNTHRRVEHWTNARDMPAVAARTLLADLYGQPPTDPHDNPPYFWSQQFGLRLQLVGRIDPDLDLEIVDGSLDDGDFVAVQHHRDLISAVIGWNSPRSFLKWRRRSGTELRAAASLGSEQSAVRPSLSVLPRP
jgi:NADPH-dependent 2,4-dienoyl-CoA reductase/sulfur reductase-like enzyme